MGLHTLTPFSASRCPPLRGSSPALCCSAYTPSHSDACNHPGRYFASALSSPLLEGILSRATLGGSTQDGTGGGGGDKLLMPASLPLLHPPPDSHKQAYEQIHSLFQITPATDGSLAACQCAWLAGSRGLPRCARITGSRPDRDPRGSSAAPANPGASPAFCQSFPSSAMGAGAPVGACFQCMATPENPTPASGLPLSAAPGGGPARGQGMGRAGSPRSPCLLRTRWAGE